MPALLVRDVMERDVVTLRVDETLTSAAEKFSAQKVSGAPVVDEEGRLVGLLSEQDILKCLKTTQRQVRMVYPSISALGVAFQEYTTVRELKEAYADIAHLRVGEAMTTDLFKLAPDVSLAEAIQIFIQHRINRIPIVDGGRLVGVLTRGNVIRELIGRETGEVSPEKRPGS